MESVLFFRYRHAALQWAYQQKNWFGRECIVSPIPQTIEGANWTVKVLED